MGLTLNQLIEDYNQICKDFKELEMKKKAYEIKIQQVFDKKELKSTTVNATNTHGSITVFKRERVYITYFAEKLKQKLKRKVYAQAVDKQYTVSNIDGLKKIFKDMGYTPDDLKQYITITEIPNKAMIKQLYSTGDITSSDLKGCFEVKITKSLEVKEE